MNKNNNKKKVKNVDLETRAVRMRDINLSDDTIGNNFSATSMNLSNSEIIDEFVGEIIDSEAPTDPIGESYARYLPADNYRSLEFQKAISYISAADFAKETHRRLGVDRTNEFFRQNNNPRWFCFGWCDNWGNGAVGYNPFKVLGIPNGTKGYLFAAVDYNEGSYKDENWLFLKDAAINFNRNPGRYPLKFGISMVTVESISQINSYNNPDVTPFGTTPFGSISLLYLNKIPLYTWDNEKYAAAYNQQWFPRIKQDENLYFIEPIPSPMEFYTDYVTLVLPLNTEIDLYKWTVGFQGLVNKYNIKPGVIPDELIEKANENFIFEYSISEQSDTMGNPLPNSDPVVTIDQQSGSIRLRRLGKIKVTVIQQFFQSKKYKVAYLRKLLNAGNSSGVNSGGKFTIDFR
jgi:hypothetical protein